MSKQRFRFISITFRVVSFFLIILPSIGICVVAWKFCRDYAFQHVQQQQKEIATSILDMVRSRHDLVQNYVFQNEQTLRNSLIITADILQRTARELELETARRNLPLHRAQDVFINIVMDVSQRSQFHVSIFSDTGKTVYSPRLPEGFDMSDHPWIQTVLAGESGDFQFSWRYPGEAETTDRLMVYRPIHGWNWIVATEGVTENPLIDHFKSRQYQGLQDYISGYHAPAGGFVMILDTQEGKVIAHPEMRGGTYEWIPGISRLINARRGQIVYQDEYDNTYHACIETFTPHQWVIAVTAREDQILHQAKSVLTKLAGTTLFLGILVVILFYRIQRAMLYSSISQRRYSDIEIQ